MQSPLDDLINWSKWTSIKAHSHQARLRPSTSVARRTSTRLVWMGL